MERFLLLLLLSAVACDKPSYEPAFSASKTYVYNYEGDIMVTHEEKNLIQSGMRLTCSVEIAGVEPSIFLLQAKNVVIENFHGNGEDHYMSSPELTKKVMEELENPVKFEYQDGHVGAIFSKPEVSNTVINIVRGILSFLDVTIKNEKATYALQEPNIQGTCQTSYYVDEDKKEEKIYVKRSINLHNCMDKVERVLGMAYAKPCKNCEKIGTNNAGIVTYHYIMKASADGALIMQASARELQEFSPYNVNYGASMIEVSKKLVLAEVKQASSSIPTMQYKNRGTLKYVFGSELDELCIVQVASKDVVKQTSEILQNLVEKNMIIADWSTPENFLELTQILRYATVKDIEKLWEMFSNDKEKRRWLMDGIITIPSTISLQFLKTRIINKEIAESEATKAVLLMLHVVTADPNAVQYAQEILSTSFVQNSWLVRKTATLAYGSLVYRYCHNDKGCNVEAFKPLHNLALEAVQKGNTDEMLLALKAIGNAGQPVSLKTVMAFLPGVSSIASELPIQVQNAAVLSLRHMALKEPRKVQDLALKILLDGSLAPEVRMHACVMIFETKPPLSLVLMIAEAILKETNMQLASFTYSHMKSMALSSGPDGKELAAACNLAVKILTEKCGALDQSYSKAFQFVYFNSDYLSGAAAEMYVMKNQAGFTPNNIIHKQNAYFFGTLTQLREYGFRIDGMSKVLEELSFNVKDELTMKNILQVLPQIINQLNSDSNEKPHISAYVKYFGQEVFFADITGDVIHEITQILSKMVGHVMSPGEIIDQLLKGIASHWTNAFLASEIRYIESTCIGLPVENTQFYAFINAISSKADIHVVKPENVKAGLEQIMTSDIILHADSAFSHIQHFIHFHGVNTDLIKIGSEYHAKLKVALPVKADFTFNIKDQRLDAEFPYFQHENTLMDVRSQLFTAIRNAMNPSKVLKTLIFPGSSQLIQQDKIAYNTKLTSSIEHLVEAMNYDEQSIQLNKIRENLPNIIPKVKQACFEALKIGLKLCFESKVDNAIVLRENPLYHFLGNTYAKLSLHPGKADSEFQKIRFKMRLTRSRDVYFSMLNVTSGNIKLSEDVPSVMWIAFLEGETRDGKIDGYKFVVRMIHSPAESQLQFQILQEQQENTWKLCYKTVMEIKERKTMTIFEWGSAGDEERAAAYVETARDSKGLPVIRLKLNWQKLPGYLKHAVKYITENIPGIGLFYGFHEEYEKNPSREISIILKATSLSTFYVTVRTPMATLRNQGLETPFYLPLK